MNPRTWPTSIELGPFNTMLGCVTGIRIEIRAAFETMIDEAARAAALLALTSRVPVGFEFNGHHLVAYPDQPPQEVVAVYWSMISNEPMPEDAPGSRQARALPPDDFNVGDTDNAGPAYARPLG